MEVVVFDKRADYITVALGQGMYSVMCNIPFIRPGHAYAGSTFTHIST